MNRFLTPDEAAALSEPAVQRAMVVINEALCKGERRFTVLDPLFDGLCIGLRAAGWVVVSQSRSVEYATFTVQRREYSEEYLAQEGARVMAMRGER